MSARTRLVIDTNVVLDLLVFNDPDSHLLRGWLDAGAIHWVACIAMRDELACVLERGFGARWPATPAAVVSEWDRYVDLAPAAPACGLHCTDPDDQKFINLAMSKAPCRLVTRDRALLRLARGAASRGVTVHRPGDLTLHFR